MKLALTASIALTSIITMSFILTNLYKKKLNIGKKKVYMDMDGNCDDMVAFALLLNFKNVDLVGVSITPADCEIPPAKEFVSKLLYKKGINASVVASNVEPINDFPQEWKSLTIKTTYLPTLLNIEYNKENELDIDGSEHMYLTAKDIYEKNKEKTTILMTGPPSTLTKALKAHPDIKDYIEEVFWMGGAIDVMGNVGESPYSEYNAYWNPDDTKSFIESGLEIKVLSLDSTNSIPVDKNLLSKLSKIKKYEAANLVTELFAIAYWIADDGTVKYYAWDCLATMALGFDDLITFEEAEVDVITEKKATDNQQGRILKKKGSGHFIKYGKPLDDNSLQKFYDYFLKTLKYNY